MYATDPQFAAARPSEAISAAIGQPGLRLPQIMQTTMEGKIGPDKDIPHVTAPIIVKYITNLQLLGLL